MTRFRHSQFLKGNAQFFQKVTFEPLMDFKQNHYGSCKYYKSCYFSKVFFKRDIKTHSYFFCDIAFQYFHETNINRLFLGVTQKI